MPKQAEGDGSGFSLAAFLLTLLLTFLAAQPKDLADHLHHAAGEIVDGDTSHGADLGNGAAVEA